MSTNFYTMFLPCQSGKTRQMIRAIRIAYKDNVQSPPIPFIMTTNHSQLTLQTANRLHQSIGNKYKLFVLNSMYNYHPNQLFFQDRIVYNPPTEAVMNYLLRFQNNDGQFKPPMFIALSNSFQIKKVLHFIDTIVDELAYPINLYFDEADITYVNTRKEWIPYLYRTNSITLITATPQPLIDSNYDEITLFQPYPIQHTKDFEQLYVNHLDTDSVEYCKLAGVTGSDPNTHIVETLRTNYRHFSAPLPNGKFRKIIAISTMYINDHHHLSQLIRSEFDFNALTINAAGIRLYTKSHPDSILFPSIKTEFCQFLHHLDMSYPEVANAPLVILGNRRIDRGVTFQLPDEDLLIRDIIVPPHIKKIPRLIQVLGRVAGYIRHKLGENDKVRIYTNPKKTVTPDESPE
jgi:hypothetical protein